MQENNTTEPKIWNPYPIELPGGVPAIVEISATASPAFVAAFLEELQPERFAAHLATARRELRNAGN
jgi:hypothetical protein